MTTNSLIFANNASTTLAGAITDFAVNLQVAAGGGAKFPNPNPGQHFVITLVDSATGLLNEIMWCTARNNDTFTILRAQEGTTAIRWLPGDIVAELWTAGQAGTFAQSGAGALTPLYTGTDTGFANAISATVTPTLASLIDNDIFEVSIAQAQTSPSVTANMSGTGAFPVRRADGTTLAVGDIGGPPFKALLSFSSASNIYLLQNSCLWNTITGGGGGGGGGATQWTYVFRGSNHTETAYNEVIHLTGGGGFTITLPSPPTWAAGYVFVNQSTATQTIVTASGGFYNTELVTGGGSQLTIPASCVVEVSSDGANWVVHSQNMTATSFNRGISRRADGSEAHNGATSGDAPAFMAPEDVSGFFFAHVADVNNRGISRQATATEAQNGSTSGSVPAFLTPESLQYANPFLTTGIGAVMIAVKNIGAGASPGMDVIGATTTWASFGTGTYRSTQYAGSVFGDYIVGDNRWPGPPPPGTWQLITTSAGNQPNNLSGSADTFMRIA